MNYYIEVTLIENDEASLYQLWSKLYTQIHLALVEAKKTDDTVSVGFSFPQYHLDPIKGVGFLGAKLRLFAPVESHLKNLDLGKWLERLADYVHLTSVREVPKAVNGYAIYQRKQVKTNADRLARRRVKRGDISFDEALLRYSHVVTKTNFPYVEMQSLSTSTDQDMRRFRLFIEKKTAEKSTVQLFSTYGLSSTSSVPEF